jgi:hypothetical protein
VARLYDGAQSARVFWRCLRIALRDIDARVAASTCTTAAAEHDTHRHAAIPPLALIRH